MRWCTQARPTPGPRTHACMHAHVRTPCACWVMICMPLPLPYMEYICAHARMHAWASGPAADLDWTGPDPAGLAQIRCLSCPPEAGAGHGCVPFAVRLAPYECPHRCTEFGQDLIIRVQGLSSPPTVCLAPNEYPASLQG